MTRVVYERRALQELRHEVRWYERRAPGLGERLLSLIEEQIQAIADAPESFARDLKHPRARRAVLPRGFPFSIVFTVRSDGIVFIVARRSREAPSRILATSNAEGAPERLTKGPNTLRALCPRLRR
jgi:plasmid stabilization system protein ParE